ncbi:MAG TPA: class I SAM-dependent methyltransferase [Methylocella sp.]|nr:class I SAM-dependent methyltransferase [Methylocella sp.]
MAELRNDQINEALSHTRYFLEWGGMAWERQFRYALHKILGPELGGLNVLDIGTRTGKMSCFFALLGANVTGIDITHGFAQRAADEAARWKVSDRCNFVQYNGNLDIFKDESFDIVFTKSVLVLVQNLDEFTSSINRILRRTAKFIFIENSKGGPLHYLRYLKHRRSWDFSQANYFTDREIECVKKNLNVSGVRKTRYPPTYLIFGQKKPMPPAVGQNPGCPQRT